MYAPTLAVAGFFFLGIIGLILLGLFAGIYLWTMGRRPQGDGDMACGQCGYAVRGLNALDCPECGADLREVGIQRPQSSALCGIGIALTVCCGGVLLLGCLGSGFLFVAQSSPPSIQSGPLQAYPTQPNATTSTSTLPVVIDDEAPVDSESPDAIDDDLPPADEPTPSPALE